MPVLLKSTQGEVIACGGGGCTPSNIAESASVELGVLWPYMQHMDDTLHAIDLSHDVISQALEVIESTRPQFNFPPDGDAPASVPALPTPPVTS